MKPEQNQSAKLASSAYRAYGAALHKFLARRLRRDQDSADLAQEVYLRLLRLGTSELVRHPQAYVYFIATQVVAQFRLQAAHSPVVFDSEAVERHAEHPDELCPDEIGEHLDVQRQLERLLAELPVSHRNVLILRKRDGLSWVEIARELGLSVHTVKKYIYEANAKISAMKWEQP